jgi:hypothetical protein
MRQFPGDCMLPSSRSDNQNSHERLIESRNEKEIKKNRDKSRGLAEYFLLARVLLDDDAELIIAKARLAVKRVLKDQRTGLYLRSMDEWTEDPGQAHCFRDVFQALKFCDEHHLNEMAVIARSKDGVERLVAFRHSSTRHAEQRTTKTSGNTERISK